MSSSGYLVVELDGISQCQRCQRGDGCGAVLTSAQGSTSGVTVTCRSSASVTHGQRVVVEIDEQGSAWLGLVFGAYGLPLLGMLVATGLASAVFVGDELAMGRAELIIVLCAVAGFLAGRFGWQQLSARVAPGAERSLCLQSARIVDPDPCSKRDSR